MKLLKVIRGLFEVWGYVSFLGVVTIVALLAWSFCAPAHTTHLSEKRARVFLNQSGLGQAVFKDILHSYQSSLSGAEMDYANAYALRLSVDPTPVLQDQEGRGWQSFPVTNSILQDTMSLALSIRNADHQPWIPSSSDLVSPRFRVMFWKVTYYSTHTEYVTVFLVDTQERILYVLEHKI